MSYKQELQDLIVRLRNNDLVAPANPILLRGVAFTWREQLDRWAEIIDFAINHPDDFVRNLDSD